MNSRRHLKSLTAKEKQRIKSLRKRVLKWGKKNHRGFAWRKRPTAYSILIAEFLLQRTKAAQAEKQFRVFLRRYPTFSKLREARSRDLAVILAPLGLKKRVPLLKKLIREIDRRYKGRIPSTYSSLVALPGVGDYTASAILIFAGDKPAGLVDANTIQVFSKLFRLDVTREEGKRSPFIKTCAEYYSSLGRPRRANWLLLDYAERFYLRRSKTARHRPEALSSV